ncbi:MAG: hypothetical protein R6W76_03435 [Caldilinea sp.]|jgi:hypothetical protein
MSWVLNCRILVKQQLSEHWAEWFGGLQVQNLPTGEALLFGTLPDHAALYGVLTHMRDLDVQILSVDAIPLQAPPAMVDASHDVASPA